MWPFLLSFLVFVSHTYGISTKDDVNIALSVIEGTAGYRILNGTNQFGAHGDGGSGDGVIVMVNTSEELVGGLSECWRSRFPDYNGKYWVFLPMDLLDGSVAEFLQNSSCIAGIVLTDPSRPHHVYDQSPFSHDSSCPNDVSSWYREERGSCRNKINRGAEIPQGLRNVEWKVLMVYMKDPKQLDLVKKCYGLFNVPEDGSTSRSFPLCGMSFGLFNSAAGNSQICFRRGLENARIYAFNIDATAIPLMCNPLAGQNVFSWPVPAITGSKTEQSSKYMIIATRLDSFGLIPDVSAGELSVLTSLIAVLATAQAIGSSLENFEAAVNRSSRFVMFAVFNGESFDYIGSSATVERMRMGVFPLPQMNVTHIQPMNLSQIEVIIEPQQIGSTSGTDLFTHVDSDRYAKSKEPLDRILNAMRNGAFSAGSTVRPVKEGSKVPPASWHSFARGNGNIQSIVLSPFDDSYSYNRYNSMLDQNTWTLGERTKAISDISAAATAMLYAAADFTRTNVSNLKVDDKFVATLFDCMVMSEDWFSCNFLNTLNSQRVNKSFESYSYYSKSTFISVSNGNPLRFFVYWILVYALGTNRHTTNVKNKKSCMDLSEHQAVYSYDWQPDPWTGKYSCYRSSIQLVQLQSPAFSIEGYDFSNTTYSTWTESQYSIDTLNLFLIQDSSFDWIMLLIGIFIALFSFFIVGRCHESTFVIDEGEVQAEEGEPL